MTLLVTARQVTHCISHPLATTIPQLYIPAPATATITTTTLLILRPLVHWFLSASPLSVLYLATQVARYVTYS